MALPPNLREPSKILQRTPDVLDTLLRDLDPAWLRSNEGENTWSPLDVVGHLVCGELYDWVPRAEIILREPEREFEPFDRFAQERECAGKSMNELLDWFAAERAKNIERLEALDLTSEDLNRTGLHPDFGEVTLGELIHTWTVHDLGHIAQICRGLAKYYKGKVGPWRAYLPVLERK